MQSGNFTYITLTQPTSRLLGAHKRFFLILLQSQVFALSIEKQIKHIQSDQNKSSIYR
jgi:hypothetical protein